MLIYRSNIVLVVDTLASWLAASQHHRQALSVQPLLLILLSVRLLTSPLSGLIYAGFRENDHQHNNEGRSITSSQLLSCIGQRWLVAFDFSFFQSLMGGRTSWLDGLNGSDLDPYCPPHVSCSQRNAPRQRKCGLLLADTPSTREGFWTVTLRTKRKKTAPKRPCRGGQGQHCGGQKAARIAVVLRRARCPGYFFSVLM